MKNLWLVILLTSLTACTNWQLPDTQGDPKNANNYGYHPMDPLPVEVKADSGVTKEDVMSALPDETMRLAIGSFTASGGITYGPAKVGVEGKQYVVVLDYVKFVTRSFGVSVTKDREGKKTATLTNNPSPDVVIPTYLGIGLRMQANIVVKEGEVDLGSLYALGAAAEANKVSGTLVIQTLGISGKEISGLVPMPSEISQSSIQNAIQSLATIKAKMYDAEASVRPRVVGVYNNLGGGEETINRFISALVEDPPTLQVN